MDLIKLLDVANPKKTRDTINLLITNYENFHDEILEIATEAETKANLAQASAESAQSSATIAQTLAESAQASASDAEASATQATTAASEAASSAETAIETANAALSTAESSNETAAQAVITANAAVTSAEQANATANNAVEAANKATIDADNALSASAQAVQTAINAEETADLAETTSAEALSIANTAAGDAVEAVETAESALQNANDATETSELAMQIATEAKSTVDQAISTGVFGTFVHNATGMSLLHAYMTHNLNQEDTDSNFYMATPKLVRDALNSYYNKTTIDELEVELQALISGKVDKETGKGLSTEDYTTAEKTKLASAVIGSALKDYSYSVTGDGYWTLNADGKLNTSGGSVSNVYKPLQGATSDFGTLARASSMSAIITAHNNLVDAVAGKVDQVVGKGLSANDYTTEEKTKLAGLENYDDTALTELIDTKLTKLPIQYIKEVFVLNGSGFGGSYPFHICDIPVHESLFDIIIKIKATSNTSENGNPFEETVYIKKALNTMVAHSVSTTKSSSSVRLLNSGITLGVYYNAPGTIYATVEIYGNADYITGEPTFVMEQISDFPSGVITPTRKEYYVPLVSSGRQYSTYCYGKMGYTPGARAVVQCGSDVPLALITEETSNSTGSTSLQAGQHLALLELAHGSYELTATEVDAEGVSKRAGMLGVASNETNMVYGSLLPTSANTYNLGRNKGVYASHAHWNNAYINKIYLHDAEDDLDTYISNIPTAEEKETWNNKVDSVNEKTGAVKLTANDLERLSIVGYSGGDTTYYYYPLVKFTKAYNSDENSSSLIVTGRIGGWTTDSMATINALLSTRGGESGSVIVSGSNTDTALGLVDLVIYRQSDNTDIVYLKCRSWFTFDINISAYNWYEYLYDGNYTTTPSGTQMWVASEGQSKLSLSNGKLCINNGAISYDSSTDTFTV